MVEAPIFQRVIEVAPNSRGEGTRMTLLWDSDDRGIVIAMFDGHEVTADISRERLLADVHELQGQACSGKLQVVYRNEALIAKLEAR